MPKPTCSTRTVFISTKRYQHLNYYILGIISKLLDQILVDQGNFRSSSFQRVFQYLRRFTAGANLDSFFYTEGEVDGTPRECVEQLLRWTKSNNSMNLARFLLFIDIVEWMNHLGVRYATLWTFWISNYNLVKDQSLQIQVWSVMWWQGSRDLLSNLWSLCPGCVPPRKTNSTFKSIINLLPSFIGFFYLFPPRWSWFGNEESCRAWGHQYLPNCEEKTMGAEVS